MPISSIFSLLILLSNSFHDALARVFAKLRAMLRVNNPLSDHVAVLLLLGLATTIMSLDYINAMAKVLYKLHF